MKKYKNKIRYYFYIIEMIFTGERKIVSVHNYEELIKLIESKEYKLLSNCIGSEEFSNNSAYKNYKKRLEKTVNIDTDINRKIHIYAHYINTGNGWKAYIGQTLSIKDRWIPSAYKDCKKFTNALMKYGWNNFKHKVLLTVDNELEANYFERFFILYFDSIKNGFNSDLGGNIYSDSFKYTPKINLRNKKELTKIYHDYYETVIKEKYNYINGINNEVIF